MTARRVLVVGAGVGGLAAAIELAAAGLDVTVFDAAPTVGGKMRHVMVGGLGIDGGPTVFTMRWVFDDLFRRAGYEFDRELTLTPASVLARHFWPDGSQLDLHADLERSRQAIRDFAGEHDAVGYRDFCRRSSEIYATLRDTFMSAQRPTPLGLTRAVGISHLGDLWRTAPFRTLWSALGQHFRDPRLLQLFGRYATYVGSSPFAAPATLMLIAHVEQSGVWQVNGGMHAVATTLQRIAIARGAEFRLGTRIAKILTRHARISGVQLQDGTEIAAEAIVYAGDCSAIAAGLLGDSCREAITPRGRGARSLSALTWCATAPVTAFPLSHHNVFFSSDYRVEFRDIFQRRRVPTDATVYLCAQDRGADLNPTRVRGSLERMLLLVNAPPDGDIARIDPMPHWQNAVALLNECGYSLQTVEQVATGPAEFDKLFPGSGGALYGYANHGAFASFSRPGAKTPVPGLYLAGGSVHPGAGVPMATLSGRLAAEQLLADRV